MVGSAKAEGVRWWDWALGVASVVGVGAAVVIPILVVIIAIVGILGMFQGLGSCDFPDVAPAPTRTSCLTSADPLVRASVQTGGHTVAVDLGRGYKADTPDPDGNRALPCAAMVGNAEAVHALLAAGAGANTAGTAGGRPIVAAVSGEGRLGNGAEADPNLTFTPLTDPGRGRIVTDLVAHGAAPGDAVAPAAERGNAAMVGLLMQLGADPNGAPGAPSPLLDAVFGDNITVVQVLLEAHADPNRGGTVPSTTVVFAIEAGSAKVPGADGRPTGVATAAVAGLPDTGTVPPIVAASYTGSDGRLLAALIGAGADVNALAFDHYSALWVAAVTHNLTSAQVLRDHGALDAPAGARSAAGAAWLDADHQMFDLLTH